MSHKLSLHRTIHLGQKESLKWPKEKVIDGNQVPSKPPEASSNPRWRLKNNQTGHKLSFPVPPNQGLPHLLVNSDIIPALLPSGGPNTYFIQFSLIQGFKKLIELYSCLVVKVHNILFTLLKSYKLLKLKGFYNSYGDKTCT